MLRTTGKISLWACRYSKHVCIRCGLVVRIPGFHPGGPGSIPGTGTNFFLCLLHSVRDFNMEILKILPEHRKFMKSTFLFDKTIFLSTISMRFTV